MEMEHDHMRRPRHPDEPGLPPSFSASSLQRLPPIQDQKIASLPSYPPPSYTQSHDVAASPFSPTISTELAPIQPAMSATPPSQSDKILPSLSMLADSVLEAHAASPASNAERTASPPDAQLKRWPSLNPLTAYYTPTFAQNDEVPLKMEVDSTPGVVSPGRHHDGRGNSVSLDDPDVRLAAEALGDLRADFVSSPPNRDTPLPPGTPKSLAMHHSARQSEPLLNLLTTSHPLLAKTIEGTTSAYNNSKNFSPRFKTSAEYVETYLSPIGNTLGSVGRVTGVEGGVRWFLGAGRRHQHDSDAEAGEGSSKKRRKVEGNRSGGNTTPRSEQMGPAITLDMDIYNLTKERRPSLSTIDTLPAYDELRSPDYTETVGPDGQNRDQNKSLARTGVSGPAPWQNRLIMSTSGLSIAMSEESLRSLKYCLRWLRWANEHIAGIISTLKGAVEQYEKSDQQSAAGSADYHSESSQERSQLAARIVTLKSDVLKTLHDVINTVSKYAGGALPENARILVRRHLTSLPQRFKLAASAEKPAPAEGDDAADHEVRVGAQKVLVLAKEGLDMMSQVSGVLDGTIVSAEEWCERLGKKRRDQRAGATAEAQTEPQTEPLVSVAVDQDVPME